MGPAQFMKPELKEGANLAYMEPAYKGKAQELSPFSTAATLKRKPGSRRLPRLHLPPVLRDVLHPRIRTHRQSVEASLSPGSLL